MKLTVASALASIAVAALTGCAATPPDVVAGQAVAVADPEPAAAEPIEYVIVPGDELEIRFFYNPELNETVTVRPDGRISLLLVDEVDAAGLTPQQLDDVLTDLYNIELRDPRLTIIVRSFTAQRVFVAGEVNQGGMLPLTAGMTAMQAVFAAGGFRDSAAPRSAFVIRRGPDDQPEPIPVNLRRAMKGDPGSGDIELEPLDIIFVPKSGIAKANQTMAQYVRDIFLFNGWSYIYTRERNPAVVLQ